MKNITFFLIIFHFAVAAFSQERGARIKGVNVPEFKHAMDSLQDEVVIDLRTPEELKQGKISGAIVIDFFGPGFESAIAALDKERVYLLYCASGARSGETAEVMKKMGFVGTLYNLEGGFRVWVKNGMPVDK